MAPENLRLRPAQVTPCHGPRGEAGMSVGVRGSQNIDLRAPESHGVQQPLTGRNWEPRDLCVCISVCVFVYTSLTLCVCLVDERVTTELCPGRLGQNAGCT